MSGLPAQRSGFAWCVEPVSELDPEPCERPIPLADGRAPRPAAQRSYPRPEQMSEEAVPRARFLDFDPRGFHAGRREG